MHNCSYNVFAASPAPIGVAAPIREHSIVPIQVTPTQEAVTARVPEDLKAQFSELARREHRSVSAELRRLMFERVREAGGRGVSA